MHPDYTSEFEDKYLTSFGKKAKIYSLANALIQQVIEDSPSLGNYLIEKKKKEEQNYNIGCIIAN